MIRNVTTDTNTQALNVIFNGVPRNRLWGLRLALSGDAEVLRHWGQQVSKPANYAVTIQARSSKPRVASALASILVTPVLGIAGIDLSGVASLSVQLGHAGDGDEWTRVIVEPGAPVEGW